MKTVVTHNGVFHADEVLAIALLKVAKVVAEFKVIRTRDADTISKADIVIDVGGEVSNIASEADAIARTGKLPRQLRFDHHQFDKEDKMYGLSSAGLVYQFLTTRVTDDPMAYSYGYETNWKNLFLTEYCPKLGKLVSIVDEHDTGVQSNFDHEFIKIINGLNSPSDIGGEVQDTNFSVAVEYATTYVNRLLGEVQNESEASSWKVLYKENEEERELLEKQATEIIKSVKPLIVRGVKFILLDKNAPFIPAKKFVGKGDIMVAWDNTQNCYTVQVIPLEDGKFGSKYSLVPTNMDNEIFCHKAGFIGKYALSPCLRESIDPCCTDSIVICVKDVGVIEIPTGDKYIA